MKMKKTFYVVLLAVMLSITLGLGGAYAQSQTQKNGDNAFNYPKNFQNKYINQQQQQSFNAQRNQNNDAAHSGQSSHNAAWPGGNNNAGFHQDINADYNFSGNTGK